MKIALELKRATLTYIAIKHCPVFLLAAALIRQAKLILSNLINSRNSILNKLFYKSG
jgi:hypothetical protein